MSAHAPVSVSVRGLVHSFAGARALDAVTLDFPAGELTALVGSSGCGKTTLLRIVAGFVTPDSGSVLIGGQDRTATPPWLRNIGFVFQSYALWPHMNALQNVSYGLRLRRLPADEIARRAGLILETVGLTGFASRFPGQLSGGQQQRVALARALVLEPDVLLLDEPLANLDAQLRIEMRREIRRLQRALGITTILVTHDPEEALEVSDRVVVMSRGRVEQSGATEDVFARSASRAVADLLGGWHAIEGVVSEEGELLVQGAALPFDLSPDLAGKRVRVVLAGRRVTIVPD